jgi:hypothetical protein
MKCKRQDCGKAIPQKRLNRRAVYCSTRCRNIEVRELYDGLNGRQTDLSPGTRGAVSELRVAADLMERGYEVFRALSPSCSCDIAVLKDGRLLRIECRTGRYLKECRYFKSTQRLRADVLAVILHDKIVYEPDLP